MTAGHPRKPTALKIMQGTVQPCRMNPNEPTAPHGTPEMPAKLSRYAKQMWREVIPILRQLRVLSPSDVHSLEAMCETWAQLKAARDTIKERGGTSSYGVQQDGKVVSYRAYPEVAIISDADKRIKAWLSEFGLTPAGRAKVSAQVESQNTFDDLD